MFLCSLFFSAHNGFGYHRAHLERTRIENIFREHICFVLTLSAEVCEIERVDSTGEEFQKSSRARPERNFELV